MNLLYKLEMRKYKFCREIRSSQRVEFVSQTLDKVVISKEKKFEVNNLDKMDLKINPWSKILEILVLIGQKMRTKI